MLKSANGAGKGGAQAHVSRRIVKPQAPAPAAGKRLDRRPPICTLARRHKEQEWQSCEENRAGRRRLRPRLRPP